MSTSEDRKHMHHHKHEMMPHVHTYITEADVADDHQHIIMGVSGPAKETDRSHVHRIHGRTSFISEEDEGGHWHTEDVMTGPAIAMPDGNHVHYFEGMTSEDDCHCHSFNGATGLGPSCMQEVEDECEEEDTCDDTCDDSCDDPCEDECVEECEEECVMPAKKMPKYKYKYGKRLGQ
jgi:hypothetical protein